MLVIGFEKIGQEVELVIPPSATETRVVVKRVPVKRDWHVRVGFTAPKEVKINRLRERHGLTSVPCD